MKNTKTTKTTKTTKISKNQRNMELSQSRPRTGCSMKGYFKQYGLYVGEGSSREAYSLKAAPHFIVKFTKGETNQTYFERKIWEELPKKFLPLFPQTTFVGRYVIMEKLTTVKDVIWAEGYKDIKDDYDWNSQQAFFEVLVERLMLKLDTDLFADFVGWLDGKAGSVDDLFALENVGVDGRGQVKILDWGYNCN
jgi:hypothetical protein